MLTTFLLLKISLCKIMHFHCLESLTNSKFLFSEA